MAQSPKALSPPLPVPAVWASASPRAVKPKDFSVFRFPAPCKHTFQMCPLQTSLYVLPHQALPILPHPLDENPPVVVSLTALPTLALLSDHPRTCPHFTVRADQGHHEPFLQEEAGSPYQRLKFSFT